MSKRESENAAGRKVLKVVVFGVVLAVLAVSAPVLGTGQEENAVPVQMEIEEETTTAEVVSETEEESTEFVPTDETGNKSADDKPLKNTEKVIEVELAVENKTKEKETEQLRTEKDRAEQNKKNSAAQAKASEVKETEETDTCEMVDPLDSMVVTSEFGPRWGRQHEGMDLGVPEGTPIYAAMSGTVTFAEYTEGFGNLVIIEHEEGLETYYAHCSRLDVTCGQEVEAEQQIAAAGSTGNSTGPHLHFEVHVDGVACDPSEWLDLEE